MIYLHSVHKVFLNSLNKSYWMLHLKKYGWESEQYLKCYTSEEHFYIWNGHVSWPIQMLFVWFMILFAYTDIRVLKLLCSCPGVEVCIEHQIDLYSNICTTHISKSTVLIFKLNVHIFKRIVDRFNSIIPIFLFYF